jgi:ABC-type dipeptide/oligopeptide/nickel transport system permease subunit
MTAPATAVVAPTSVASPPRRRWAAFARNRAAVFGLVVLVVIIALVTVGPWLHPADPAQQQLLLRREPPSTDAWLGRDGFGRDILVRLLLGGRSTLVAAFAAVVLSGIVGSTLGVIAGFYGGWRETLTMRGMDLMLSFPYFLLALLIVAVAGTGLRNAALAVAIAYVPQFARVVRGATLEVRNHEYVDAAHVAGLTRPRIIALHILPNVAAPIIVLASVGMAMAIIGIASLSFLGLGAQPPSPEWGAMLADGRAQIATAPHITIFPGVAILLTVLSLNLLGDGLRDYFDPRTR